jgi:phage terminase small subunit
MGARKTSGRVDRGLTPKQRKFALEYLVDLNGTQAAIRAGYSAKAAECQASRLLRNVKVAALLAGRLQKAETKDWLKVEDLERELSRLVNFDPAQLIGADGKALPLQELDEDTRRALSGVDVEELFEGRGEERKFVGLLRKVRWHDKRAAIELAMKRRQLLVDRLDLGLPANVSVSINFSKKAG